LSPSVELAKPSVPPFFVLIWCSIAEEKFQYSGVDAVNTEGKDSDAVTEIKKLTKNV
jgi:hypothetical protein